MTSPFGAPRKGRPPGSAGGVYEGVISAIRFTEATGPQLWFEVPALHPGRRFGPTAVPFEFLFIGLLLGDSGLVTEPDADGFLTFNIPIGLYCASREGRPDDLVVIGAYLGAWPGTFGGGEEPPPEEPPPEEPPPEDP